MTDPTQRPLPDPDDDTRSFWEGTERRRLEILRCTTCATYVHYPKPACWNCGGTDLAPAKVSGNGTIYSYTITHRPVPGFDAPFNVIMVELDEQPGLRMISNLVDAEPRIGMKVEVTFQPVAEGVWLPLFRERAR